MFNILPGTGLCFGASVEIALGLGRWLGFQPQIEIPVVPIDGDTGGIYGGVVLLRDEIHFCPTCGSRLHPGFSLSGMWINFTTQIKNRWACDSGHIWDEPLDGFPWEH